MSNKRLIDNWLLRNCPRYRLWRICKAIGIKPYLWQRWFALGKIDQLPDDLVDMPCTGKTVAIMLRILMIPKNNAAAWAEAGRCIQLDPDYYPNWDQNRLWWYSGEYRRLKNLCLSAGIPVLQVEIYRMLREFAATRLVNDTV